MNVYIWKVICENTSFSRFCSHLIHIAVDNSFFSVHLTFSLGPAFVLSKYSFDQINVKKFHFRYIPLDSRPYFVSEHSFLSSDLNKD